MNPELLLDFDAGDPDSPTALSSLPPLAIPVKAWGPLCYDLVLAKDASIPQVCAEYAISERQLNELLDNKRFLARLKEARTHVNELGPNAGFILAARIGAEQSVIALTEMVIHPSTPAAVRVSAAEKLVQFAKLDPRQDVAKTQASGVTVQFNIGGGLLAGGASSLNVQSAEIVEE